MVGTARLKHELREAKAAAGRRATPAAVAARRLLTMTVTKRRKLTAALGIRGRRGGGGLWGPAQGGGRRGGAALCVGVWGGVRGWIDCEGGEVALD